jgi:four helix bundle protein
MHPALELQARTKRFAIRIMNLCSALATIKGTYPLANQLLRSGTSVAANYRAACRSRSDAEFISKIGVVLEEADETEFWLELLRDGNVVFPGKKLSGLIDEAEQLVKIFSASKRTAQARTKNQKSKIEDQKSRKSEN